MTVLLLKTRSLYLFGITESSLLRNNPTITLTAIQDEVASAINKGDVKIDFEKANINSDMAEKIGTLIKELVKANDKIRYEFLLSAVVSVGFCY